ncbi:hypothetical protein V6N13_088294 [Hibiscus sabdariffa]
MLLFSSSRSNFITSSYIVYLLNKTKPQNKSVFVVVQDELNLLKRVSTCNALFGLGVPELAVIAAGVAVLVFGPKKLPENGKSLAKTVDSFQQLLSFPCLDFDWYDKNKKEKIQT